MPFQSEVRAVQECGLRSAEEAGERRGSVAWVLKQTMEH